MGGLATSRLVTSLFVSRSLLDDILLYPAQFVPCHQNTKWTRDHLLYKTPRTRYSDICYLQYNVIGSTIRPRGERTSREDGMRPLKAGKDCCSSFLFRPGSRYGLPAASSGVLSLICLLWLLLNGIMLFVTIRAIVDGPEVSKAIIYPKRNKMWEGYLNNENALHLAPVVKDTASSRGDPDTLLYLDMLRKLWRYKASDMWNSDTSD
ncbi:unnamed protein product [Nezara viridula]|uniref:Uncharacterized protein n=1 Tax=Nezara viridula TaxID=85310 RepID=A0A9P0MRD3_NEZVI|nr:unnamed protein product [Nezara viridula]